MKKLMMMCAGLIFLGSTAQAALVQPFGIGARNAALGEAVSAHATDAFAVYYNPAGLSNIDAPVLTTGLTVYDAEVYYKNFAIIDSQGKDRTQDLGIQNTRWKTDMDPLLNPHMGFAMPVNDKISFGIAAYAPYGFHIDTDKDPFQKPMGFNAWESMYTRIAVTPAFSYKINDRLSFGLGLSLGRSSCKAGKTSYEDPFQSAVIKQLKAGFTEQGYNDAQVTALLKDVSAARSSSGGPFITTELDMEDSFNWSWNAGIQYQPTDRLSLGLTYRSRANGDFKGDFIHNGQKVGSVSMPYDHPDQVQVGLRYALTERLAMSFDMVWANWSINAFQHEYITSSVLPDGVVAIIDQTATNMANAALQNNQITQDQYAAFQAQQKAGLIHKVGQSTLGQTRDMGYNRDWSNEIQYKLGVEYVYNDRFTFLAGYVYDPTPVPAHTFDNGWPDTDRHLMNLGASVKVNANWTVDVAFQHIRTFDWGYRDDVRGTSENLNKTIGGLIPVLDGPDAENGTVHVDNQGYLWAYSLTANYRF
ncbi:outer membrane protein transport protein [Desulfobotulus sp. H1]|uniref:Outer membrane protein transport protein n=1 Tax=Desulfobotulus pelophilus TaxID=2823377 RepID=A0ABT3N6W0_9BACT|nr:outer membrane protein transport protein [Desulfobotulus pelophilus]MCW7753180.1 outer membrane protein transport protein [Desulfobotulus pelophilus]